MAEDMTTPRRFRVTVAGRPRGGIALTIPFDPGLAWGERDGYHVHGTVGGQPFRGPLTDVDGAWSLHLGPSWCRSPGFGPGDEVAVVLRPEGPHSTTMGADVAAAFAADPAAARFFDSLPSFYRNNHARWIESARRSDTRAKRIVEVVELSRHGKRER
jgi:bacteriocin resistance YdeI/OmpD-like protein/uncharacterized protein DUF1905